MEHDETEAAAAAEADAVNGQRSSRIKGQRLKRASPQHHPQAECETITAVSMQVKWSGRRRPKTIDAVEPGQPEVSKQVAVVRVQGSKKVEAVRVPTPKFPKFFRSFSVSTVEINDVTANAAHKSVELLPR